MPIVLAVRDVEARGLFEPKSLQPVGVGGVRKKERKKKRKKGEARN